MREVPTIDALLAARAEQHPAVPFLRFADGDVTFADAHRRSTKMAHALARFGVACGDLVPVLMPNGSEFADVWLGLCALGAVSTLLNTAFRGPALVHALNVSGADTVVVDPAFLENLAAIRSDLLHVRRVVVAGDGVAPVGVPGLDVVPIGEILSDVVADDEGPPAARHSVRDPAMVLFTSGTTGRSKGCVLSHRYAVRQAQLMIDNLRVTADDVMYCPFPMFHIDALVMTVAPALVLGTTAAIADRFSASGFWDDIRRTGATVFDFMGATLTMLHKRPRRDDDHDNPARLAWGVPVPVFAAEFEERFGVQLVELYGSTDAGIPIYQPVDEPRRAGSCGRLIPQYDVRLLDDDGHEVPTGDVGEFAVRPNEPSLMSDGYYGMPEETIASRRDLWFHTGDLGRRDADGWFFFVGRRAETIRRRGENISAFEVEEVVKLHPAVLDAAAFGVPSELTEDDVMIVVVPRQGHSFDAAELVEFCASRMAAHMLPRYVDTLEALPRTPTEKVEKARLRERGVTGTTWDRDAPPHPLPRL